jgi:hypothetical protein
VAQKVWSWGLKRYSYLILFLQPVYQATLDLNFRLLSRTYFQYSRQEILVERARLPLLKAEKKDTRVQRSIRRRKAKNGSFKDTGSSLLGGLGRYSSMADQVTGIAGGATNQATGVAGGATNSLPLPGGLGMIAGSLQGGVGSLINTGQGYLDRWFPPDKRESLKQQLTKFATERPKLAAFIMSQIALSGLPLGLFIVMTITVVLFALIAGLLVGLIGALLFIVFALGFALVILLPTLFFTTFAATFIFLFGLGAYYIVKWFNEKSIPGIHTPLTEGVKEKMGMTGVPALEGRAPPPPPASEKAPSPATGKPRTEKLEKHDKDEADDEKENKAPRIHKETPNSAKKHPASSGKSTGADITNGVSAAPKALGGVGGDIRKKTSGFAAGV